MSKETKCKYCKDLDEMDWEHPRALHEGEKTYCEDCGAEYHRPYNQSDVATNDKAKENHPELEKL